MSAPGAVSEAEAKFDALRRRVGWVAGPVAFAVLLAVPMPGLTPQAHALAAVGALIVIFWVTEAIPLAAAALLGPALAVVLGVAPAKEALREFSNPLIFLFLGGFMLAGALSKQGFDRRAALWLISRRAVQGSPTRAMVAVACIAFVFSMWISNTATTAMLLPVVLGLHGTIRVATEDGNVTRREIDRFGGGMCLTMAYAASIGGMATPIGTGPNAIAIGVIERNLGVSIDFLQWMSFALPAALVMVGLMLLVAVRRFRAPVARVEGLTTEVERQLAELGPLSRGEIGACAVFGLAIFGWLLPSVFRLTWGAEDVWSTWAHGYLHEGVVAIVAAALLFAIPSGRTDDDDGEGNRLLGWREAQAIDWGTLMLLGGGLALGDLTSQTGLADAIGHGIMDLAGSIVHHPLGLTAAAAVLVVFLTEVTSNTATISMMLPVLIGVARAGGVDPIPTAIAVTLAGSMAFMLPVATPPNAMAYGTRMIRIDMMIRTGVRLNLIGFAVLMLLVIGLLPWVL